MNLSEIARLRMYNQGLTHPICVNPAEVVAWNGAVQSQDYAGAKWALAQRVAGFITDTEIDQAYNEGSILRTHVMRPTWHFVTPADIRWMLALTAPRVNAANAYYYRALALDATIFAQSNDHIIKTLEGGKHLTRAELGVALRQAGIDASDLRLTYLVMRAELDGILCSGPRHGKQFTYALLEERVAPAQKLTLDEALAELTKRYFTSHGPALLKDFAWWSGLTLTDAKKGVELIKDDLYPVVINGQSYWMPISTPRSLDVQPPMSSPLTGYLLPNYDESLASYKDYSAATAPEFANAWSMGDSVFAHYLVINGWVVGTWRRTLTKNTITIETRPFAPLSDAETEVLTSAAHEYAEYLDVSIVLKPPIPHNVG